MGPHPYDWFSPSHESRRIIAVRSRRATHFLAEDRPEETAAELLAFLADT